MWRFRVIAAGEAQGRFMNDKWIAVQDVDCAFSVFAVCRGKLEELLGQRVTKNSIITLNLDENGPLEVRDEHLWHEDGSIDLGITAAGWLVHKLTRRGPFRIGVDSGKRGEVENAG